MGKLGCFLIEGIDCWFWSSDHRPPHFNARRRGEWEVRVFFMNRKSEMIEPGRGSGRIPRVHRKLLTDLAEQYREELLKEWEKKVKYAD